MSTMWWAWTGTAPDTRRFLRSPVISWGVKCLEHILLFFFGHQSGLPITCLHISVSLFTFSIKKKKSHFHLKLIEGQSCTTQYSFAITVCTVYTVQQQQQHWPNSWDFYLSIIDIVWIFEGDPAIQVSNSRINDDIIHICTQTLPSSRATTSTFQFQPIQLGEVVRITHLVIPISVGETRSTIMYSCTWTWIIVILCETPY